MFDIVLDRDGLNTELRQELLDQLYLRNPISEIMCLQDIEKEVNVLRDLLPHHLGLLLDVQRAIAKIINVRDYILH